MRCVVFGMGLLLSLQAMAEEASTSLEGLPLLREDAALPFPWASVVLVLLLAGAAAVIWVRRHRGALRGGGWRLFIGGDPQTSELRILSSARLDKSCVLYDVQWRGRHLLVASSDSGATVVADAADRNSRQDASIEVES